MEDKIKSLIQPIIEANGLLLDSVIFEKEGNTTFNIIAINIIKIIILYSRLFLNFILPHLFSNYLYHLNLFSPNLQKIHPL